MTNSEAVSQVIQDFTRTANQFQHVLAGATMFQAMTESEGDLLIEALDKLDASLAAFSSLTPSEPTT